MKFARHIAISSFSAMTALVMLLGLSANTEANAAQVLKNAKEPIVIQVQKTLDSKATQNGDTFEGVLSEDYQYNGAILPAGTKFKGTVSKVNESRRFARPGYVVLNVQEMVLPTGEIHQMSLLEGMGSTRTGKINNKKARTLKRFITQSLPMHVASLATSVPLTYGIGMSSMLVAPIALGARMATGAAVEVAKKDDEGRDFGQQISYGLWRGSGVPGTYEFVTTDKQAHFEVGANMPLKLTSDTVEGIFMLKSLAQVSPQVEPGQEETVKAAKPLPDAKDQIIKTDYSVVSPITPVDAIRNDTH